MGVGDEGEVSMADAGREIILELYFRDIDRVLDISIHVHAVERAELLLWSSLKLEVMNEVKPNPTRLDCRVTLYLCSR